MTLYGLFQPSYNAYMMLIGFGLGGFFFPYVQNFKEFKEFFFPPHSFIFSLLVG